MSDLKIPEKIPLTIVEQDAQHVVVRPTEPPIEQPYILRPELYGKNRTKLILRQTVMGFFGVALGIVIVAIPFRISARALGGFFIVYLPIFSAFLAFTIWRKVIGLRRRYFSFKMWMDANGFRFESEGSPPAEVTRQQITTCLQVPGKGTMVKTAVANRYFWIADELNAYDLVLNELRRWGKLEERAKLPLIFRPWVGLAVVAVTFLALFLSRNPWVVTAAGLFWMGFVGYQLYLCTTAPQADAQLKRQRWTFLLSAIVVLVRVLYVWTR